MYSGGNAPDGDVVVLLLTDRWTFLHYHRHITHSIVGTLAIALLLPLLFWLGDRLIARWRSRPPKVRLKGLLLASLIVSATHPFLDWTNNYGVRLLLPWSSQWSYGDLVFIVDPFIWLVLGGAAFLLTSTRKWQLGIWLMVVSALTYVVMTASAERGLTNAFLLKSIWVVAITCLVVAHRLGVVQRWGPKIAWAAFGVLVSYWIGLAVVHSMALREVRMVAATLARQNGETVTDMAAMPSLANPFYWQGVVENDHALIVLNTLTNSASNLSGLGRFERAARSPTFCGSGCRRSARANVPRLCAFPGLSSCRRRLRDRNNRAIADLRYTNRWFAR